MACVYVYLIVLAFLGPEKLGRNFGVEHDSDKADAMEQKTLEAKSHKQDGKGHDRYSSDAGETLKESVRMKETV